MIVNQEQWAALKQELLTTQAGYPQHSLDWNIFQGRIDLLTRVEELFETSPSSEPLIDPPVIQEKIQGPPRNLAADLEVPYVPKVRVPKKPKINTDSEDQNS